MRVPYPILGSLLVATSALAAAPTTNSPPAAPPATAPAAPASTPAPTTTTAPASADVPANAPVTPVQTPEKIAAQAAFERGRRLWEDGTDLKAARAALDEAIADDPAYAEAYLYRAEVSDHDYGLKASKDDYEFALKLDPKNKEIYRYYGEALSNEGQLDDAEKMYDQALALDPNYADAIYLLARVYTMRNEIDKAIPLYEKHAEIAPKGTAHHALGEIYYKQGKDDLAAKEFALDLAVDPTCYDSRIALAGLAFEHDDYQTARSQYEESLIYHTADARALSGLGRTYLALGDYEMAVATLRQALNYAPDDQQAKSALTDARHHLRMQYGWPFALFPGLVAAGAVVGMIMQRRKR